MTIEQLLQQLQLNNIHLELQGDDRLRLRAGKGFLTPELQATIKQHKPALIAWLQQQQAFAAQAAPIVPAGLHDHVPLSLQQQRLWLSCQTDAGNAAYQIPAALLVSGELDVERFARAVNTVIARHTLLHCEVREELGRPVHVVAAVPQLEIVDGSFSGSDMPAIQHYAEQWLAQALHPAQGPLLRLQLVRLQNRQQPEFLLLLNIHHLLTDGWSNRLLLQQIINAYDSTESNDATKPFISYFDYIAWQQQQLQNGPLAQQRQDWQQHLHGMEALALPTQQESENTFSHRAQQFTVDMAPHTLKTLYSHSQLWQVSSFAMFLAAYQLTLYKLAYTPVFGILAPFANRRRDETLETIGFFVNLLPLKADFSAPLHLQALVQQCHQAVQHTNAVSEVPFALIADTLNLHNADEASRFFPAAISHEADTLLEQTAIGNIRFQPLAMAAGAAKFPLLLNISERHTTSAWIEYNDAIFSHAFIQRFAIYFRRALHAVVFNPQQTVNAFSLLTEAEQLALLGIGQHRSQYAPINLIGDSNRTATTLPDVAAVHELFMQQVQATPDAIAVSDDASSLDYRELARQSSQVAQYLSRHYPPAKHRDNIIGICLDRSVNVSVVLLGILQAGYAYLPLDTQLPQERLQFMLEESGAVCVISHSAFAPLFEGLVPCVMIDQPAIWQPATPTISEPLRNAVHNPLFNLVYTSGSTGKPKGVRVLQRGIINRLLWMQAQYPLQASDVVLQKTPLSFDVSVWELFWPLLCGARLHFAKPDGHRDTAYLHEVICQKKITTLHFVPSMLELFLENPPAAKPTALKRVFCSGEALLKSHVSHFRQYLPGVELHNLYGPTEAAVDVSFHDCASASDTATVPIGKPIWNTQLHIFDNSLRPVAPGTAGEIVIGGMGLAEGYQANDSLTEERFIDNPFYIDGHPSARLYKTGDIGRHLADGSIEFLGRNDTQVKLRGLRIELGDIEHHALQYPGMRQAAAAVISKTMNETGNDAGSQQMVLFYASEKTVSHSDWREFLLQHLPHYMLPNGFINIQKWPFTASGKTDRKALLVMYQPAANTHYQAADNETRQYIQQVWERHFAEPVGLHENFFEAGGHSLLAMRIIAELAEHFQVNLQFRDIFSHGSIAELAALISTLPIVNTQGILPAPQAATYPASFQQQRLYLFQALYPQSTVYNMPMAVELKGKLDIPALQKSLHYLIQRHAVLHTVYGSNNEQVWQKPLPHYEWQLDRVDVSHQQADASLLAQHHAQQVFNLHLDLPLKAALYTLANEHYLFCLCVHHIAGDAVTLSIIARELAASYKAFTLQQAPALPELPVHYHDFAVWQRRQDNSAQLAYWQTTLSDAPELLALPHDNARTAQQNWQGAQYRQELDNTLVDSLLQFSQQQQLTPFIVLLSTLQVFLGKLAQQDDVCIGVPIAGRNHGAVQNLAGFFVNSIIMRSQHHDNPNFDEFLQQQKNLILAAFAHQDIPLEQVLEHLAQQRPLLRSTSHNPIAQIGFNFLQDTGTEQLALTLPHLAVTPLHSSVSNSKYEMTWIFYQHSKGIQLAIEYNTGLFFAATVQQWAGYFITMLNEALAAPQTPLQQLCCISKENARAILQQAHTPVQQCYPLTATQRDIYLDSLFFRDKRHNQLGFLTHSSTMLDMGLWRTVLQDLYNHADSLRARIKRTAHPLLDIAWQVIAPAGALPEACFKHIDHGEKALTEATKKQAAEMALFSAWPENDPLWRVHIHQFAGNNYLFILAAHHAMFDGVSIQMLGRMIKGNYQRRVEGLAPEYPANNYADYVEQHRLQADSSATYHFWQKQAAGLQPYLDLRPLLQQQPDSFASIETTLSVDDWQQLQQLCKNLRTTPPLFFKAVFALAIKAWHRMTGNFCFTEVVLGREREYFTTQGLFFEQQPNIIDIESCGDDATLVGFLSALRQYRKQIAPFTPVSLRLQQQLLPATIPYLFNFYIMESATPFFGKMEKIEHLMPEMDHAVNCIVKVIDQQAYIQLMYNRGELQGEAFLAAMVTIIHRCLHGETHIARLLPEIPVWQAARFSTVTDAPTATAAHKQAQPAANALEQHILAIWQEVLGKQDIGTNDNFFELGGHSLHAMRIANRLREQFAFDMPLGELFRQPTVAAIALYLQADGSRHKATALPPILPAANREVYPLSYAQQRLWFLTQLDTANPAYNIPAALQLEGNLDQHALLHAIEILIERQQVLRSIIDNETGAPRWRVLPASSISVGMITAPLDAGEHCLTDYINSEAAKPFAINNEALIRITLLAISANQHILLLTLHHLIADAASLAVIARELGMLYHAFHHRQDNPLPALDIQFADYACWQQQLLHSHILQQQLDYWRTELAQAPELLGLPIDHARPPLQTFNGASLPFAVPHRLAEQLRSLAQANGVTLFMLLLASYQLLLARLCKQHDVCVGIPRDGRVLRELEPLAGFFVNALVIRTRFDADYGIDELLGKVRDKTLAAFANDLVPAEQVMQALQLQRQLQFTPIVQAAFNYLTLPDQLPATDIDGLHISLLPASVTTAKFELLLTVTDTAENLQASLEYNRDLFDEGTITTIHNHWLYLLEVMTNNPAARISQLHLPGMARHKEITCLHAPALPALDFMQAISRQAASQAQAVAVICGQQQLAYGELENNANIVAQQLLDRGIRRGDRVAICLPHCIELLPAILGTIKAGACYVPLDVHYPAERLAYMLDNAGAAVVIGKHKLPDLLPATNAVFMDIDSVDFSITGVAPAILHQPDDLLYLIYTSGSTGLPKGTAVYHRNVANLLAWYTQEFAFSAQDKTLVMSSTGFDLTQKNLFAPLITGGTLVLANNDHYDANALLNCIATNHITLLNCAPSAFYPLLETATGKAAQALQSLRCLLLGGEPIQIKRLAHWITADNFHCSITNMYGPTECTDISAFHTLPAPALKDMVANGQWQFPLGKPSAGVSLYVLNDKLQHISNGLAGELCINGHNVGAGYWQQPELTATVFVPNPFATHLHKQENDQTFYRSGDKVRLNPDDGLLYFIGREDFQLKLRGLRIEAGEIEQALRDIPDINDSVVMVDNEQLLAFVLATDNPPTEQPHWRTALQERLPGWMIPALILPVNSWPLTTNGKINRQALLALPRPENPVLYTAPRTALEQAIAEQWHAILGNRAFGIFDNFFDAGGNSLAAVRLVSALEQRFNVQLPVTTLFGAQTIAQQAMLLENPLPEWSPVIAIQPHGEQTPIFALPSLGAVTHSYASLSKALGNNQPFYGLQAYGFEEGQTPFTDLDTLLAFYVQAIRRQQPVGPYQFIGHSFGGILALELARKLLAEGETINFVGLLDTYLPLRYGFNDISDAQILQTLNAHTDGALTESLSRRAIAIVRGIQQMMEGFTVQPLGNVPLLLFTPQDMSTRAFAVALHISQMRNIKTRGFEKLTNHLTVVDVAGDHFSLLNVDGDATLVKTLHNAINNT